MRELGSADRLNVKFTTFYNKNQSKTDENNKDEPRKESEI